MRTLKIKKVDDKPMVIHTKEKAKIHAHEPKGAKIKGSNIYTVERGPKTIGKKSKKLSSDDKRSPYRKSTIHQSEPKNKVFQDSSVTSKVKHFHQDQEHQSSHCRKNWCTCSQGSNRAGGRRAGRYHKAAYLAYEIKPTCYRNCF